MKAYSEFYLTSRKNGQEKPDLKYFIKLRNLKYIFKQVLVSVNYDTNTRYYYISVSDYKDFKKWILFIYEDKSHNFSSRRQFLNN